MFYFFWSGSVVIIYVFLVYTFLARTKQFLSFCLYGVIHYFPNFKCCRIPFVDGLLGVLEIAWD